MTFRKRTQPPVSSTKVSYDGDILEDGSIEIRKCTLEKDAEGNVLGKKYHRHVIHPGDDYSHEPAEVQAECLREHTVEKVNARAAFVLALEELL
tara:strand:+ start:537 stop:818 length:282 start_codon:yes stop_codon:yes gene_type:complete